MSVFPASRFRQTDAQIISSIQDRIASIDRQITGLNAEKAKLLLRIQSLQSTFSNQVLNVHNELMEYFQNNYYKNSITDNDFFIPYVPTNYNLFINDNGSGSSHSGLDDYKECVFPYSMGGSRAGSDFTFIYVYGYFTVGGGNTSYALMNNSTTVDKILGSGRYHVSKVEVNAINIGSSTRIYNVPFNNISVLRYYMNNRGYNNITWTIDRFSYWAKTTAFLAPSSLCFNHYISYPFGNGIMPPYNIVDGLQNFNLSVAQTPTPSLRDSSIVLPNVLQRNYYDRLHDFMKIKNYTEQQAINVIKNFVM